MPEWGLLTRVINTYYSTWVGNHQRVIIHDPMTPVDLWHLQVTQFCLRQIMRNRFEFVALEQQRLARASWKMMEGDDGIYDGYVCRYNPPNQKTRKKLDTNG